MRIQKPRDVIERKRTKNYEKGNREWATENDSIAPPQSPSPARRNGEALFERKKVFIVINTLFNGQFSSLSLV